MNDLSLKKDEPIILALDTSSKETTLSIARGKQLLESLAAPSDEKRSERLWIDIRELLEGAGLVIGDVDLFGVCVGPGGFTGLRVGISAAKGLAAATGKPIAGITSLEAAAFGALGERTVCAMVNAYKGEVFSQLFKLDEMGAPIALNAPSVSTSIKAIQQVADCESVVFVGDAAVDNAPVIKEFGGNRLKMEEDGERRSGAWRIRFSRSPVADSITMLSYLKFKRGEADTSNSLQACYVRQAEAEIKLSEGLLGSKIRRSLKAE